MQYRQSLKYFVLFLSKILVVTHDGSSSALTLSAGQAAARVPGAGGACGVGETHNLEQAANTEINNKVNFNSFQHSNFIFESLHLIIYAHFPSYLNLILSRKVEKFFDPKNFRDTLIH